MSKYELRFFKASFFCPEASELIDEFQKESGTYRFATFLFSIGKTIIRFWSSNKTVADGWEPLGVLCVPHARVPKTDRQ
jgi:hypothetical protein